MAHALTADEREELAGYLTRAAELTDNSSLSVALAARAAFERDAARDQRELAASYREAARRATPWTAAMSTLWGSLFARLPETARQRLTPPPADDEPTTTGDLRARASELDPR